MSRCNLDGVNMYCWTHGKDIDQADYIEGVCAVGWAEREFDDGDDPRLFYEDDMDEDSMEAELRFGKD